MNRRNGKSKIHLNRLVNSWLDHVQLARAVGERFAELQRLYLRETGNELRLPREAAADHQNVCNLLARYACGDMRHTASEWRSLKTIAQWTVNLKAVLCRQPAPQIEWSD